MADREALRQRFEELARCTEPGQYATVSGEDVRAVAELIRETEPRVLTLEEMRYGAVEVAWLEARHKSEVIPGIWFRFSNEGGDESVDIHVMDGFVGARLALYGKTWRCWTARPTEGQRKAAWNE